MKLIYCPNCKDLVRLFFDHRTCKCGLSGGMYKKDGRHAIIDGQAIPIGIDNYKFQQAIDNQEEEDCGYGTLFPAFVIPKGSAKIELV